MNPIHRSYRSTFLNAVNMFYGAELAKEIGRVSEDMVNDPDIETNYEILYREICEVFDDIRSHNGSEKLHAAYTQMVLNMDEVKKKIELKRAAEEKLISDIQLSSNPHFGLF